MLAPILSHHSQPPGLQVSVYMSSMCRSLRMSIAGSLPNKKFKKHCHRPRDARATSTPRSPVN